MTLIKIFHNSKNIIKSTDLMCNRYVNDINSKDLQGPDSPGPVRNISRSAWAFWRARL